MVKRSRRGSWLAPVSGQLAISARVIGYVWTHPANSGQRVRALLRAARYQAQSRLSHKRTVARLGERSRIWGDLHRTGVSMITYVNPPNLPEMPVWRRALRDGDLFVDVGANVGTYTLLAAELGAEVIALEPAADTFSLLRENIALNGYQVTALQAAAADRGGTARFTAGLDAGNRLDPDGSVITELVTIDSLIGDRQVTGMKVDVEGFRVILAEDRDAVGMPRVKTDLRFSSRDVTGVIRFHEALGKYLSDSGCGHLEYLYQDLGQAIQGQLGGGSHQIGTTRMSARPHDGVVDQDLAVHGFRNPFVASSSALPTARQANPTFMVIALRLADHLTSMFRAVDVLA